MIMTMRSDYIEKVNMRKDTPNVGVVPILLSQIG